MALVLPARQVGRTVEALGTKHGAWDESMQTPATSQMRSSPRRHPKVYDRDEAVDPFKHDRASNEEPPGQERAPRRVYHSSSRPIIGHLGAIAYYYVPALLAPRVYRRTH